MNWNDILKTATSVVPVNSSNIDTVLFRGGSTGPENMVVRFSSGAVYLYDNVEPETFISVIAGAETRDGSKQGSIGAAFHQMIRSGDYPYRKLEVEHDAS